MNNSAPFDPEARLLRLVVTMLFVVAELQALIVAFSVSRNTNLHAAILACLLPLFAPIPWVASRKMTTILQMSVVGPLGLDAQSALLRISSATAIVTYVMLIFALELPGLLGVRG
jgi:hypothetical protein